MKKALPLIWAEVNSILSDFKPHDFCIALNYGLYSTKTITRNKDQKTYKVYNHIDGTTQHLTYNQIHRNTMSNINKAITKKAFYAMD